MFISTVFAARRLCFLAKKPYWVKPLTADGWATVLQWLDDFVPGQEGRKGLPRFDAPECQELLAKPEGRTLEIWLALEGQGVTYDAARDLWRDSDEIELERLHAVLFTHRKTAAPPLFDDGSDISETWCGKGLAVIAGSIGLKEIGGYSLDQITWLLRDGEADDENPAYSPEKLAEIQKNMTEQWGEKLAALSAQTAQGPSLAEVIGG